MNVKKFCKKYLAGEIARTSTLTPVVCVESEDDDKCFIICGDWHTVGSMDVGDIDLSMYIDREIKYITLGNTADTDLYNEFEEQPIIIIVV